MSNERLPQLVYRVTPERRKELKQWATAHDTTFQELFDNAIEAFINASAEVTEDKPTKISKKNKPLIDGQRRLVHYMPDDTLVNPPDDQWKKAPWGKWAELVMLSEIEGAATGLGSNIENFLGRLGGDQLIDRLTGEATDATDPNAPDYAAAAEACEEANEQLRRYFAAKWKGPGEAAEDSDS